MKIVKQSADIIAPFDEDNWREQLRLIEYAGRIAYKSEDKMTDESYHSFLKMIVDRGHLAVIEFGHMTVHFVTDRGISHEIVRHRLCSFVQESTRYCNYGKDKFGSEVTFIKPSSIGGVEESVWKAACYESEKAYLCMLDKGVTPQQARSVLPNSLKTEIIVKANFREWRHIFQLRAISKAAHPDMRALMIPLYQQCRKICPEVFEMGEPE